jgi:hypothetical protein
MKITRPMLEELLALTVPGDGDDEPVELTLRQMDDGPEGPGLYAYYSEYPEEGVTLIDGKSEVLGAEGRASVDGVAPCDVPSWAEVAQWLHAAYDRPPQTPEVKAMLARVDAAALGVLASSQQEEAPADADGSGGRRG